MADALSREESTDGGNFAEICNQALTLLVDKIMMDCGYLGPFTFHGPRATA